jgi:hypothetical protein
MSRQERELSEHRGAEVRAENLQELIHAVPFQPFRICLADGTRVDVPHPDFIAYPPGSRVAAVVGRDESTHYIDVMLVLSLEIRPSVGAGQVDQNPNGGE